MSDDSCDGRGVFGRARGGCVLLWQNTVWALSTCNCPRILTDRARQFPVAVRYRGVLNWHATDRGLFSRSICTSHFALCILQSNTRCLPMPVHPIAHPD